MKSKTSKIVITILLAIGLVFGMVGIGYSVDTTVVLNFDEYSGVGQLPANYAGLSWQNGWYWYNVGSANYLPHSGGTGVGFIYDSSDRVWIDFSPLGKDVMFNGAWFGGHSETGNLWFEGWRDGVLVATSSPLTVLPFSSNYLASNFSEPVDKVFIVVASQTRLNEFRMDDFSYTIPGDISVDIDVKPYDFNTVNIKSNGLLPISVMGSEEFDVMTIDVPTVMIGAVEIAKKSNNPIYSYEDINLDGYLDLLCKFDIPELVASDELNVNTISLTVTGNLVESGDSFVGSDDIIVVPIK